ncbi:transglutaminase-like domain-containing protein [Fluviispira vulneris]|uniref:transglutaminase-like domain-containing protein n=1 Tax=Fluviispira vulneris TaxID=2763012 RepID=UPI0016457E42|nr:transglutaminase domain-containing protein [Fluviispira vulneris]
MNINIFYHRQIVNAIIILFFILFVRTAMARWQKTEEVTHIIDYYNREINVDEKGLFTDKVNAKITLTKDSAPDNFLTHPISYDPTIESFKVIEAYTIYEGKKYKVPKKDIEDKSIASNSLGFRKENQILIKFHNVKKGAELYLSTFKKVKETLVPNLFAKEFLFNFSGYLLSSNIKINSKIPLYSSRSDKNEALEFKELKNNSIQTIEIKLKKPYLKVIVDEDFAFLNISEVPMVAVSSLNSWQKISDYKIKKYEEILSQKIPDMFANLVDEAAKQENINDKINVVTSGVAEKIKYFGDWRSLESGFDPRDLAEIAKTGLGDCKDYSIMTTALLRKLGITAHVAYVYSSIYYEEYPVNLPNLNSFNHMIVQVENDGKIKWIDPTQGLSYAQGIFPNIAGRNALVVKANSAGLEYIPALTAEDFDVVKKEIHDFSEKGMIYRKGSIELKNFASEQFTALELQHSKETIDNYLANLFSSKNSTIISYNFAEYDFKSRILSDKVINYNIKMKSNELKTDLGNAYMLNALDNYVNNYLFKTDDRKSDLYIKYLNKFKDIKLLKNVYRSKTDFKGCEVNSKWADFSRKIVDTKEGVEIIDFVETKQMHILNQDLLSKEFNDFQEELDSCINRFAIINSSKAFQRS